jgi:hypothetical protein
MAIEAVKIPQNVYVEDRIIGPVTLKQLMITGIGCGISYMFYAIAAKSGVATIPITIACWIPGLIAAMFAFAKINDLSLFNIILLMIESTNKPNLRIWSPHPGLTVNIVTRAATQEIHNAATRAAAGAAKLAEVSEQFKKRQEELSKLTAPVQQTPTDIDAIGTKFQSALQKMDGPEPSTETTSEQRPVNTEKVKADGALDQSRSIDNIASDLQSYDKLMSSAHS